MRTVTLRSCNARLMALSACADTTSPPMTSVAQTASDIPRVTSFLRSKTFDLPSWNLENHPGYRQKRLDFLSGDVVFEGSDASRRRRWDWKGRHRRVDVVVTEGRGGTHVQTDRRTRDRVRLFFWAVLTVVCLVAVVVARQQQTQGLQRKTDAAQERAVRFTQNVLAGTLDAQRVARPIERSGYDELLATLKHGLFNDQRVVRVRVWDADGLLVFTTDDPSQIGVTKSNDATLRSALRGDMVSAVVNESFARDRSTTPEPTALFSTFVPLRTADKANVYGAVQIDNDYALMADAASHPWKQMQIAFAIVAILCLVMAIVSFIWSHRKEEVAGFGPSTREVRAGARDEKKASAAQAEAAKLRERVKELEGKTKSVAEQQLELEKLRGRVAEFEQRPAPAGTDPAEVAQLKAHATQLEEQARGAESRVSQLQSRVTEMEAQLRVTTDQMKIAQQRAEEAQAAPEVDPDVVPAPIQAKLDAAAETEQLLRDELEAARAATQRVEQEREALVQTHEEEMRSQAAQLDQVRVNARLAEEERQRILAEAASGPTADVIPPDAQAQIAELTQQLERSEAERAMLRAGRPETVYEARNRQLEDELAELRAQLAGGPVRPRPQDAPDAYVDARADAGVDPGVLAALEERVAAAEERAREAERRLDEAKPRRSRSRATQRANGNGNGTGQENGKAKGDGNADAASTPPRRRAQISPSMRCRRSLPPPSPCSTTKRSRRRRWTGASSGAGWCAAPTPGDAVSPPPRPCRPPGRRSVARSRADRPRTCRGVAGRSRRTATTPADASRSGRPSPRGHRTWATTRHAGTSRPPTA